MQLIRASGHSRFPVAEGSVDHLVGIVQTKELLTRAGQALDIPTAADVLEAIAGDVALSVEEAIAAPVQRDDGSWLIDGMMPIDEFETLMSVPGLAEDGDFDTVAGLVVTLLQKLPSPGDRVERWPLAFEVVDLDGRRIDKLIVRKSS